MTPIDVAKRRWLKAASASALGAFALTACDSKPGASAAGGSAAASDRPLKVGFVYLGPVGDGGWTFTHDQGRKAMEKAFPGKVQTTVAQGIAANKAEQVFRDMAKSGHQLIFGNTFEFMEQMYKVAQEFPDVKFEHCTGYKNLPNLATYESRNYEGAYMAGVLAGKMTKTNILGVVASIPIPEVLRNINSFTLGAQHFNPGVVVRVEWIGSWHDSPKEIKAATALMDGGADILIQQTDSFEALRTAGQLGKHGFGWNSDMADYGGPAHLGSSIINWGPYYTKVVGDVLEGRWKADHTWWGVKEGVVDLVSLPADVPNDAKARLDEVKAGLKNGSFQIWKGPIVEQSGQEVLARDEVATDKFLKAINFYVKGVEGAVPPVK